MFKVLNIQYNRLHSIEKELVHRAVVNGKITAEEYQEIVGEEFPIPDKGVEE